VRHKAWPDFGRQVRRLFHGNPDRCGYVQNMASPRRSSSQLAFQLIQSSVVFRQRPCDVIRALHTLFLLGLDHERCDRRELQVLSTAYDLRVVSPIGSKRLQVRHGADHDRQAEGVSSPLTSSPCHAAAHATACVTMSSAYGGTLTAPRQAWLDFDENGSRFGASLPADLTPPRVSYVTFEY